MSTNGDHEMADAIPGAEVDTADVEIVEPQRIRVVSILSILFSISISFLPRGPPAEHRCNIC